MHWKGTTNQQQRQPVRVESWKATKRTQKAPSRGARPDDRKVFYANPLASGAVLPGSGKIRTVERYLLETQRRGGLGDGERGIHHWTALTEKRDLHSLRKFAGSKSLNHKQSVTG